MYNTFMENRKNTGIEPETGPVSPVGRAYFEDVTLITALNGRVTEDQRAQALNRAMNARIRVLALIAEAGK